MFAQFLRREVLLLFPTFVYALTCFATYQMVTSYGTLGFVLALMFMMMVWRLFGYLTFFALVGGGLVILQLLGML